MGCNNSKSDDTTAGLSPKGIAMSSGTMKPTGPSESEKHIELHIASRNKRNNVIAQAQLDGDIETPSFDKTPEQGVLIDNVIKSPDAFFFTGVHQDDLAVIKQAMEVCKVNAGDVVIRQGDNGDYFYIVERGNFKAVATTVEAGKNKQFEKAYGSGTFFGELALAYNKPRAATVTASTEGSLFRLEAKVFRYVIAHSAKRRYQAILDALKEVDLLWNKAEPEMSNLNEQQLARIAESVEIAHYPKTTNGKPTRIITRGEAGRIFYMIKEGTVVVKNKEIPNSSLDDKTLSGGQYFGEQSLITEKPRNASVECTTDVICLCLSLDAFQSILGPLNSVIEHNAMIRHLDAVDLFKDILNVREKKILYDAFQLEFVSKGQVIVKEGDIGDKFYLIKEGSCSVEMKQHGKIKDPITKGKCFGAKALMEDVPREATICALEEVELLTMTKATFASLLDVDSVKRKLTEMRDAQKEENAKMLTMHATSYSFGDLKQLAVLGSGTFGKVTLVQHKTEKDPVTRMNKVYALKAMLKSEIVQHKQQENVMQEKATMIVCSHPFVLRLYQTFKDQYYLYMLLEFVQGGELFSVLHPAHPPKGMDGVPDHAAKFYGAGVLLAIAYLHNEKNIAYRDMKPENCLIDQQGYPKLVDFGFAKVISSKSYTLCGTPEYLAPELVLGRGHNRSVDYWAYGIMLYEMQAGNSPFADPHMDQVAICKNIVRGNLKFERNFNPDCKDLVKKLLNKDIKGRLGNLSGGTDDIRNHKWFKGYDWDGYTKKKMKAPFPPKIKNAVDVSNFDQFAADDHILDRSYKDNSNWAEAF